MIGKAVAAYVGWRNRRALRSLRRTFARLGVDLSGYTDAEVERGLRVASGNLAHLNYSPADAREAMETARRWRASEA